MLPPPQRAGSWIVREVEEAEEWVVEGASHGLADTTCFELYGFPNQAPALSDSPNSKAQVIRFWLRVCYTSVDGACCMHRRPYHALTTCVRPPVAGPWSCTHLSRPCQLRTLD